MVRVADEGLVRSSARTNEATENLPDYDTQGALQRKRLRMPVCSPT
jgi:hypothetical protein